MVGYFARRVRETEAQAAAASLARRKKIAAERHERFAMKAGVRRGVVKEYDLGE